MTLPSQSALESLWPDVTLKHVVTFSVPGHPVPKPRARVRQGQGGYYPDRPRGSKRLSYPEYRELVQVQCLRMLGDLECDLSGRLRMSRGWPVNEWNYHQFLLVVVAVCNQGDAESVSGTIADALEGLIWANDKQVRNVNWCVRGRKPSEAGLVVGIWEIEGGL